MIKIGLILFPGSNCERETAMAVKRAGMQPIEFLWNEPFSKLANFDGYILIGGFSYEDRSRAGIIAALDPLMLELKKQSLLGKPILGICNGAQILVEAGFFKDLDSEHTELALTANKRIKNQKVIGTGFYNSWVSIRMQAKSKSSAFTSCIAATDIISLPLAHAEGRFIMSDKVLAEIMQEGLAAFVYCDSQGNISEDFPVNPNGSIASIAAITDRSGSVMAIMPHPERTVAGDGIFHSMKAYIENLAKKPKQSNSRSSKAALTPQISKQSLGSHSCISQLIINDNEALTVQKTLRTLGFPVSVERYKYWSLDLNSDEDFSLIKASELLFCPRKEREVLREDIRSDSSITYLVEAVDDIVGLKTLQAIKQHLKLPIKALNYQILWKFSSHEKDISALVEGILKTQIIGSNYAHRCYLYT